MGRGHAGGHHRHRQRRDRGAGRAADGHFGQPERHARPTTADRRHRLSRRAGRRDRDEEERQDQIVEAVNAEDIGKLPDNGIGESIARLPGISAQRSQGRANIISIRGFGPDFSVTTLNGREQTTTNDSRAVEFDQFPSEVLNQVVVYKTPAANLTARASSAPSICAPSVRSTPASASPRSAAGSATSTRSCSPIRRNRLSRLRHLRRPVRARHARRRIVGVLHRRALPDARLQRLGLWQHPRPTATS